MKKTSLWSSKSLRILPSWIYAPKNSTGVKTLGADVSSVTFPEFFTQVKQNPRWIYLGRFLMNLS